MIEKTVLQTTATEWLRGRLPTDLLDLDEPNRAIPKLAKDPQAIEELRQIVRDMPTRHRLFLGDARYMDVIPDASVHLVLTSPPYWTLKQYPDREGQFEVEVTAADPRREQPVQSTTRFWAVNHGFDGENLDYTNVTLETERDIYEVGETARIFINAPVRAADALMLIAGRKRQEARVVRLNGSARLLELPIIEEYIPSAMVPRFSRAQSP